VLTSIGHACTNNSRQVTAQAVGVSIKGILIPAPALMRGTDQRFRFSVLDALGSCLFGRRSAAQAHGNHAVVYGWAECLEPTSTAEVVRSFNAAWAAGDIAAAMMFVAENAAYALYISNELMPVGGETIGHANIELALRRIRADFDYLLYRPLTMFIDGDTVRFQVEFSYRHRRSGEVLSGRFRLVVRVEGGKIMRVDEYHDRAKVEAFLRLFGSC
jgi:ketosteroid isomerase-like protein